MHAHWMRVAARRANRSLVSPTRCSWRGCFHCALQAGYDGCGDSTVGRRAIPAAAGACGAFPRASMLLWVVPAESSCGDALPGVLHAAEHGPPVPSCRPLQRAAQSLATTPPCASHTKLLHQSSPLGAVGAAPRCRWRHWCVMGGRRSIPHRVRARPRTRRAVYLSQRSRRPTPPTVRPTAGCH